MYTAKKECRTCRYCGYPDKGCMASGGMPRYMDETGCPLYAMSAKAFLESVLNAQRRIESMQERANTYRELAASVGGGIITGSHGSGFAESHIEKHMNAYMLIIEDIEKEIEQLRRRIHDVTEAIACLPDVREKELLELRYLNGMRWIDMVKRLGYEDRQLRRIHEKALENIQRDMDLIAYARKNPLAPAGGAACVAVQ